MLRAGLIDPVTKIRLVACGPRGATGAPAWVVIDKPQGIRSVPGKGRDHATDAATWLRSQELGVSGPVTVHRLDQETSGLLLMAGDAETQRALSMQFEKRAISKTYRAKVRGEPPRDELLIEAPLRPDYTRRPRQVIDWQSGRAAVSRYVMLRRGIDDIHEIMLEPITGRTHQLRVHCAYVGTPIVGDSLYGSSDAGGLQLRATRLGFFCPVEGIAISVNADA